jgi:hypothetical protein
MWSSSNTCRSSSEHASQERSTDGASTMARKLTPDPGALIACNDSLTS